MRDLGGQHVGRSRQRGRGDAGRPGRSGPAQIVERFGVPRQLTVLIEDRGDRGNGSSPRPTPRSPRRMAAIARRRARSRLRVTAAADGPARSTSNRRTPPRITRCCSSGVRHDAQRHTVALVDQRRIAAHGMPAVHRLDHRRNRTDIPFGDPPPFGHCRGTCDRRPCRCGEAGADGGEVAVGVEDGAFAVGDDDVEPQVRRHRSTVGSHVPARARRRPALSAAARASVSRPCGVPGARRRPPTSRPPG